MEKIFLKKTIMILVSNKNILIIKFNNVLKNILVNILNIFYTLTNALYITYFNNLVFTFINLKRKCFKAFDGSIKRQKNRKSY